MAVVPMRKKGQTAESTAIAKPYEPTAQEMAAQEAYCKRRDSKRPVPKMKVTMGGDGNRVANISVDHPNESLAFDLLAEAVGADNTAFLMGALDSVGSLAQKGGALSEVHMNFALSMVAGIKPKDQIEAVLGIQMAAIHIATMQAAACVGGSKTREVYEGYERSLNRLARTFAAQVEALKRYRSKGEQRVYVERVNVEKGGQAIVGNVGHRGGAQDESGR